MKQQDDYSDSEFNEKPTAEIKSPQVDIQAEQ